MSRLQGGQAGPAALLFSTAVALAACGASTSPPSSGSGAAAAASGLTLEHVAVPGGPTRTYDLHLPSPMPSGRLPVVLLFSGATQSPISMAQTTSFDQAADAAGVVVVYPKGYQDTWNEGAGGTPARRAGIDDVAFTAAIIAQVEARLPVDPTRVVAAGISNGALLTELLGCRLAGSLAAIVPVEGPLPAAVAATCRPARPLSVLEVHGTADHTIPYTGGSFAGVGGGTTVLSAPASASTWARLDGCPATPAQSALASDPAVTTTLYTPCTRGTTVTLATIVGGTHAWPTSVSFDLDRRIAQLAVTP